MWMDSLNEFCTERVRVGLFPVTVPLNPGDKTAFSVLLFTLYLFSIWNLRTIFQPIISFGPLLSRNSIYYPVQIYKQNL